MVPHVANIQTTKSSTPYLFGSSNEGAGTASVHTLAQPGQNTVPLSSPQSVFQKRARSKYFSLPLAVRLAELHSPLEQSYRNTIYCAGCITQEDGKLTANYCGNRWCLVCNRIRTARAIEAYTPILESWSDPYMVTLSLRNCEGSELGDRIDVMLGGFLACKRSIRRTHNLEFSALRKLECTYNVVRGDYHPHFHVIVEGKQQAELLRSIWLDRFPELAGPKGQQVKRCEGNGYLELFKYFTKLTTKTKNKGGDLVPVEALDVIFQAMRGHRVWQPLGFVLPKDLAERIEGEKLDVQAVETFKDRGDSAVWVWTQAASDWVNEVTGETLSEYAPSTRYEAFVRGILPKCSARGHPALRDWLASPQ